MRATMKYIVALTEIRGILPFIQQVDEMKARVTAIFDAPVARNRNASTNGKRPARVFFVGIVIGEGSVQSGMAAFTRIPGVINVELIDPLLGTDQTPGENHYKSVDFGYAGAV